MNIYRIQEERKVTEEDVRKSPHHVELLVDPTEEHQQLFLHTGEQLTPEDLLRTVSLLAVSSYQGMKEVPEYAKSAELFKKSLQKLFADESFWHEGEEDPRLN